METQHQVGKQPEKAQKSNENEQPFSETTPLLPSQMALANPNPNTLTPAVINALQRTHGNHYVTNLVQRMRLTQSPPFLIRRRVPEAGDIDDEALETPIAAHNAINVEGLRTVLRRVVQDITRAGHADQLLSRRINGVPAQQVIDTGDSDQLQELIRQIEADPQLQPYVLESTTQTFVNERPWPFGSPDRLTRVITAICQELTAIGTTDVHRQHLRDVFGDDPQYGWQQVKPRFTLAATALQYAYEQGLIGADRTGAQEEMYSDGTTPFQGPMIVNPVAIDNPETPYAKVLIVHELFHFAFDDVRDEGEYIGTDKFRTCTAQSKFTNAAHYEESYQRTLGRGEVGREYRPSADVGGTGPARTPNQQAFDEAVTTLRRAWNIGVDVHNTIREKYNLQQNRQQLDDPQLHTTFYHSRLLRLTYHRRYTDRNTPINEIDIALAEGVARRLNEAKQALRTMGAVLPFMGDLVSAQDNYMRHGLSSVGQITGSTDRDLIMAKFMSQEWGSALGAVTPLPAPLR